MAAAAQVRRRWRFFWSRSFRDDDRTWEALVRPGRRVRVGERIVFSDELAAEVVDRGEYGLRILQFDTDDVFAAIDRLGHVPLPPYIRRPDTAQDRERYQTVFASDIGSVAAPTAGLHFTPEMLEECRAAGAIIVPVTLHVGLGTFAPLHAEVVEKNRLHQERFHISPNALDTIRAAERRIGVGTTSVRAVESSYIQANSSGETNLFIYPGYHFRAIDVMLTNFHLPKSSLLMLVSAFAGKEFTLEAYWHAVEKGYRFFSYGDCMLIL